MKKMSVLVFALAVTACGLGDREFLPDRPHRIANHGFEWGGVIVTAEDTAIMEFTLTLTGIGDTSLADGEGALIFNSVEVTATDAVDGTVVTHWYERRERADLAEDYGRLSDMLKLTFSPSDINTGGFVVANRYSDMLITIRMTQDNHGKGGRLKGILEFTDVRRRHGDEWSVPLQLHGNPAETSITF